MATGFNPTYNPGALGGGTNPTQDSGQTGQGTGYYGPTGVAPSYDDWYKWQKQQHDDWRKANPVPEDYSRTQLNADERAWQQSHTQDAYNQQWNSGSAYDRWNTARGYYNYQQGQTPGWDSATGLAAWDRANPVSGYENYTAVQPGANGYMGSGPGATPGPAQPAATTPNWEDMDFTKRGALENAWQQYGDRYWQTPNSVDYYGKAQDAIMNPGMAEDFSSSALSQYGGGRTPGVSNELEKYYSGFGSRRPELSADMSKYYDNAGRQGEEKVRAMMAAKGMYNSSGADDQTRELYTNLAADRAKAEAQYGLDRSNAMLGWENAGAGEAQGVDQLSNLRSSNERDWLTALSNVSTAGQSAENTRLQTGGTLASNADDAWLSALNGGFGAAQATQGANRQRGQDYFNNQLGLANALSGVYGDYSEGLFGGDKQLLDDSTGLALGEGINNTNQGYRDQQQGRQNLMDLGALFGKGGPFAGLFGSG